MKNYKFYTPLEVADLLIEQIPDGKYENIIDICCGSWNLLFSAQKKYPDAKIIGVDIDNGAEKNRISKAKFYQQDGRVFAVQEYNKRKVYDLILSNPPFGYIKVKERLFIKNTYGNIMCELNGNRYENEMIKANFLLADENSIMMFILPSTFVDGDSNRRIRRYISQKCIVHRLIKLPMETFGRNMINTYAIILQKTNKNTSYITDYIEILYKEGKYSIGEKKTILYEEILEGNWNNIKKGRKSKIEVQSFRGKICSKQMTENGEKVLHCSSKFIDGKWVPTERYCDNQLLLEKSVKSIPGDILVNRVGRHAGYWSVNEEEAFISDCLMAFRTKECNNLLERFQKGSIEGRLKIPVKGVTTKYISKADVVNIL